MSFDDIADAVSALRTGMQMPVNPARRGPFH